MIQNIFGFKLEKIFTMVGGLVVFTTIFIIQVCLAAEKAAAEKAAAEKAAAEKAKAYEILKNCRNEVENIYKAIQDSITDDNSNGDANHKKKKYYQH